MGYSCADLEKQKIHIETNGVVDTETIGVVDTETTDVVEKINIISSESSTPVMDGSYKLLWCRLNRHHKINLEDRRFGVIDEVLIKDGKLSFIELNRNYMIQAENREKINFAAVDDTFFIEGYLDLDSARDTEHVLIKGSTKTDNNGLYIGEGLWNEDKEKKKSESIEVLFQPIGDDIKLLEKRCPYN